MGGLSEWLNNLQEVLVYDNHAMVKNAKKRTVVNGSDRNLCFSQYYILTFAKESYAACIFSDILI
jgi:hypothetical protein